MIYNPYLLGIILATLFSWATWVVVLLKLSPFTLPQMALSAFFASLFIALTGTFALFIYYLHLWRSAQASKISDLNTALRQGFLLSAMINIGLVFQRQRVLTWWDGLLLLFIVLLIEYYFMSRD
jgi:hypothetical protein